MPSDVPTRFRRPSLVSVIVAVLLLVVVLGVGMVVRRLGAPGEAVRSEAEAPAPAAPRVLSGREQAQEDAGGAAARDEAGMARVAPSFDVVRVGPGGDAVLAGRAQPGDEVTVRDGDSVLGRVTADARGEWVLTPDKALPPGGRELTLSARSGAGGAEVVGSAPVLLAVPDASGGPALAVEAPEDAAPRVLQAPRDAGAGPLGLDAVDYDDRGHIRFAGHASPGAVVRLYADNRALGDAAADAQGRWSLAPASLATGLHQLRVDQIGVDAAGRAGKVVARVELPFRKVLLPKGAVAKGQVVVQPGENLWRLARTAYGEGLRYTVILRANRGQIRDPALIYPGQAFTVPALPAGAGAAGAGVAAGGGAAADKGAADGDAAGMGPARAAKRR
ncbi:MAG: LysM peptidoglycan-binding domain-containing protein [Janthinobacterium lividum]